MRNYKTRYFLIFGLLVLACTAFLYYVDLHSDNYLVYSETSEDNRYTLELYQIDHAQMPYGPVPFKAYLRDKEDKNNTSYFESMMYVDGRLLTKEMIDVEWNDDSVMIVAGTPGGGITRYAIYFDGGTSLSLSE